MAIPAIPQNINIQQGNLEIYLSWDIVAGATSYDIQRSTDGVNYSSIGTSSVNNYTDATPVIDTGYYFQIASVNGSGTSSYNSQDTSGAQLFSVATRPGQLSLYELRLRSKERADKINSNFITTSEWNFFINQAYYELYDLLITVYEDYYVAPRLTFGTDGSSAQYALPDGQNYSAAPALYKLYGADLGLDNSPNAFVTLKKFDFIARNRYVFPQITSTLLGVFNLQYRLIGGTIMFIPVPSAGQTIGLWYYPRLRNLIKDNDVMDGISGWTQYVIARAAKYALDKEESDSQKLDEELLYLKQRIEGAAQNRDAGQGDTISNTRTRAERWGGYAGYDGPVGGV